MTIYVLDCLSTSLIVFCHADLSVQLLCYVGLPAELSTPCKDAQCALFASVMPAILEHQAVFDALSA